MAEKYIPLDERELAWLQEMMATRYPHDWDKSPTREVPLYRNFSPPLKSEDEMKVEHEPSPRVLMEEWADPSKTPRNLLPYAVPVPQHGPLPEPPRAEAARPLLRNPGPGSVIPRTFRPQERTRPEEESERLKTAEAEEMRRLMEMERLVKELTYKPRVRPLGVIPLEF